MLGRVNMGANKTLLPAGYKLRTGKLLDKKINSGSSNIKLVDNINIIPLIIDISAVTNAANWATELYVRCGTGDNQDEIFGHGGDAGGGGSVSTRGKRLLLYNFFSEKFDIDKAMDKNFISIRSSAATSSVTFSVIAWLERVGT